MCGPLTHWRCERAETEPMSPPVQNENINLVMEQARETGKLDLSNLNLLSIPPETFEITNLVELDLSHNAIACIPSTINRLTALKTLKLDDNRLTELPRYQLAHRLLNHCSFVLTFVH